MGFRGEGVKSPPRISWFSSTPAGIGFMITFLFVFRKIRILTTNSGHDPGGWGEISKGWFSSLLDFIRGREVGRRAGVGSRNSIRGRSRIGILKIKSHLQIKILF